jgi:hypothetical protein
MFIYLNVTLHIDALIWRYNWNTSVISYHPSNFLWFISTTPASIYVGLVRDLLDIAHVRKYCVVVVVFYQNQSGMHVEICIENIIPTLQMYQHADLPTGLFIYKLFEQFSQFTTMHMCLCLPSITLHRWNSVQFML